MHTSFAPRRRDMLRAAAAGLGLAWVAPRLALARVASERRFVFLIQRGAADGMATLAPYADPAYARLRGALAADVDQARRLDGSFALHPALVETDAAAQDTVNVGFVLPLTGQQRLLANKWPQARSAQ